MQAFSRVWTSLEVKESELFPLGDVVVSRSHVYARARGNGCEADWPLLQFFRLRGERIFELKSFHWDTAALVEVLHRR